MKLMDVSVEQIDRMMARVVAGDPAVYDRFGVGARIKALQDNLSVCLVNVFTECPVPEDPSAEMRIAYEMHVQDCEDCGMSPLREVLGMQWLEDSYDATMEWCIAQGIL